MIRKPFEVCGSPQIQPRWLVRAAVAAVLSGSFAAASHAAEPAPAGTKADEKKTEETLEEVQVTGSRIIRKELTSNSPLVTIDKQQLEDNTFISIEQALNDLPQFMAGGVGNSTAAVTGLQAANGLDGGRGSGDMFNMALLPDNAGSLGVVVPGAANVNLRGLGANRSLVLVDGHRGMPSNASMTVDLNTIPTVAIGNIEVITGGASAVYGADALAGVTNIKFRDNFQGLNVRVRGGLNEVGDGAEYQFSGLMGSKFADDKGSVTFGLEYSKRDASLWKNRSYFREVMESGYSNSGDFLFAWDPYFASGGATGSYNVLQKAWNGNAPNLAALVPGTTTTVLDALFGNRTCVSGTTKLNCIATNNVPNVGNGWAFNPDGSLYVRSSQVTAGGITSYYGPQGYNQPLGGTRENPNEVSCNYAASATAGSGITQIGPFAGNSCNPTINRVDWGRWLTSPREAYTAFGSGTYQFNEHLTAFSNFNFASSNTQTRREPAPLLGNFGVAIPFHTSIAQPDAKYLPSIVTVPAAGQVVGQTVTDYLPGGSRGTSCAPMGGCTMAQAFPVSAQLRTLLESRPNVVIGTTGANANNPFRGLSACNQYLLATNPGGVGVQTNPNGGALYTVVNDPNTGLPLSTCGPNSNWGLNQQPAWLPVRATDNTGRLYQLAAGLRGDLGLSDWTWELYTSYGDSQTQTNYDGFQSILNYQKILSAPNYGKGFREEGLNTKTLRCTSGLNPFDPNLVVSADCLEGILSNQIDRNSMVQRIHELNTQGHVFDLPAGEVRGSLGLSYRKNDYKFTADSQRARTYIGDASAGAFGVGKIDEGVTVKEEYGELLVPLLRDLPFVRSFELELGARNSKYSTGQTTKTYKALASWEPVVWLRARGGYNRAERAPNLSELFATPSGSAQFLAFPTDPCRSDPTLAVFFPGPTPGSTTNNTSTTDPVVRAHVQDLCRAQISFWGNGSTASDFHTDPANWNVVGGSALIVGNPNLKNERGDTWTLGVAFSSPFTSPLLHGISGTVDWYEARVANPIEVQSTGQVVNGCFNINGLNPTFALNDPNGYCKLIERDASTGAILRVYNTFGNQNKLVIRGLDTTIRWIATMSDLGLESVPGSLSVNVSTNYLIDQIQLYGGTRTDDFAGYSGASRIRGNTGFGYLWGRGNRVTLNWEYREGTQVPTTFAATAAANGSTGPNLQRNPLMAGYHTNNQFSLTGATRLGPVNASLSINNLLNTKPGQGGYDLRDPNEGLGTFSPFDDLVGRRYSLTLSVEF